MTDDLRCCGTGTCIINADGQCWCGQQWDGEKMCHPPLQPFSPAPASAPAPAAAGGTAPPQPAG
jgi:hypothetical protein